MKIYIDKYFNGSRHGYSFLLSDNPPNKINNIPCETCGKEIWIDHETAKGSYRHSKLEGCCLEYFKSIEIKEYPKTDLSEYI